MSVSAPATRAVLFSNSECEYPHPHPTPRLPTSTTSLISLSARTRPAVLCASAMFGMVRQRRRVCCSECPFLRSQTDVACSSCSRVNRLALALCSPRFLLFLTCNLHTSAEGQVQPGAKVRGVLGRNRLCRKGQGKRTDCTGGRGR